MFWMLSWLTLLLVLCRHMNLVTVSRLSAIQSFKTYSPDQNMSSTSSSSLATDLFHGRVAHEYSPRRSFWHFWWVLRRKRPSYLCLRSIWEHPVDSLLPLRFRCPALATLLHRCSLWGPLNNLLPRAQSPYHYVLRIHDVVRWHEVYY